MQKAKEIICGLLGQAGVAVNGPNPWDIQVKNENVYRRILSQGTLGLGEAYMDGWWDCPRLDEFFFKVLRADLREKIKNSPKVLLYGLAAKIFNMQSSGRAFHVAERHYDLGNKLFLSMLDKRMVYSCAYWKDAASLDEAQEAKLDLVCRKMQLKQGMRILEIGCGWGSFARFAAEKYGVSVVGITISKEQKNWGDEFCKGLPVELRLQDYRSIKGTFDGVVSIAMLEAAGHKNFRTFMQVISRSLKDGGLFLLHTIGNNISVTDTEAWINKYIFPNGMLPSMKQISQSFEGLFVMEDWHNFGPDYDKTLLAWFKNFDANWPKIKKDYGDRFYRMWKYYLLSCAGIFRSRNAQLWQMVFSKKGILGGYNSVR